MALTTKKLTVEIEGDESKLKAATRRAERDLEKLEDKTSDFSVIGANIGNKISDIGANSALGGFISEIGEGTTALGAIAGPAALAAGAILAVGTAAFSAGQTLFALAQQAADYGGAVQDAREKTGLSLETLSALKFAADASGTAFEGVSASVTKFSKLVAEANQGNKDAAQTLIALGVDPQQAINNLDDALTAAYQTIKELPDGVIQSKAAMDAFGKSGTELLPFIKFFEGDVAALKEQARELGMVLTEEDIKAADDFADTLGIVQAQLAATAAKATLEFVPQITEGIKYVGDVLKENQETFKLWGDLIAGVMALTKEVWNSGIISMIGSLLPFQAELKRTWELIKLLHQYYKQEEEIKLIGEGTAGTRVIDLSYFRATAKPSAGGGGGGKAPEKSAAEKALEEAKRLEEQLKKTLQLVELENKALTENVEVTEAEKLAIDLSLKSYDKLIPTQYQNLLATQRQIDAERNKIKQLRETISEYEKATQKFEDLSETYFKDIARIEAENPYTEQLREFEKDVFSVIERIQEKTKVTIESIKATSTVAGEVIAGLQPQTELSPILKKNKKGFVTLPNEQPFANIIGSVNPTSIFMQGDDANFQGNSTIKEFEKTQQSVIEAQENFVGTNKKILEFSVESNKEQTKFLIGQKAIAKIKKEILTATTIESQFLTAQLLPQQTKLALVDKELNLLELASIRIDQQIEAELRLQAIEEDSLNIEAKRAEAMQKVLEAYRGIEIINERRPQNILPIQSNMQDFGGGLDSGLGGSVFSDRFNQLQEENPEISDAELERIAFAQEAYTQLGQVAGAVIGSLAQAMGSLVEQWVLYGDISGDTAKKAIASALAMASSQAAASAIMETAYGIAALTPWGAAIYGPASLHFKSAALFGSIAVGTALAGRAVAGDSFKTDSSPVQSPGVEQREEEFDRGNGIQSSNIRTFQSFTEAVKSLEQKLTSMPAGEVLTVAKRQNPGLLSGLITEELKTNRTATTEFGKTLGLK